MMPLLLPSRGMRQPFRILALFLVLHGSTILCRALRLWSDFQHEFHVYVGLSHLQAAGDVGRQRDNYRLPPVPATAPGDPLVRRLANLSIASLSVLAGWEPPLARVGRGAPQRKAQTMCIAKAGRMVDRLARVDAPPDFSHAWRDLVGPAAGDPVTSSAAHLVADRCDLLDNSARVDPSDAIAPEHLEFLRDPEKLFQDVPQGMAVGGFISAADKAEYCKLVVRQLRCNKVRLQRAIKGWTSVFTVGKHSGAQREVWNGSNLSRCALRPPKPPHIATPAVFADIEVPADRRLHLSKRDARCYFDQLMLPPQLRDWFGRPPVTKGELLRYTDINENDLGDFGPLFRDMKLADRAWPASNCWPMVFHGPVLLRNLSS